MYLPLTYLVHAYLIKITYVRNHKYLTRHNYMYIGNNEYDFVALFATQYNLHHILI